METESHAVTHVKNGGAGMICCARGLGLFSSESGSWCLSLSCSLFIFHIAPVTSRHIQASKAEIHQKNNLKK